MSLEDVSDMLSLRATETFLFFVWQVRSAIYEWRSAKQVRHLAGQMDNKDEQELLSWVVTSVLRAERFSRTLLLWFAKHN
jgi:hypothetical protein